MGNLTVILIMTDEENRMCSAIPKVLHKICGMTMLDWVLGALPESETAPVAVVGTGAELIKDSCGEKLRYVEKAGEGTGGALIAARKYITSGRVLVMACDLPLISADTVKALVSVSSTVGVLRSTERDVAYCFDGGLLGKAIDELAGSAFSVGAVMDWFAQKGERVVAVPVSSEEATSVSDRVQLAECAAIMRSRINKEHMLKGVTFIDPSAAYIDAAVTLGRDCVIYPSVVLEGETDIGEGTTLYPACRISNSKIGENCVLQGVIANEAIVGDGVTAGPYVHLRPKANIGNGCKIGNYIEVKNSNVGEGTKLPHLSYIGDSDLGKRVNMGCGCVTVNYNGVKKHRTTIGDDAFIGCNTSLVAPVKVGDKAYTAAGSVITSDIPGEALALGRARQINKEGYARKLMEKKKG